MSRSVRAGEVTGRLWQTLISARSSRLVRCAAMPSLRVRRRGPMRTSTGASSGRARQKPQTSAADWWLSIAFGPTASSAAVSRAKGTLDRTPHRVDTLMPWPKRTRRQHSLDRCAGDARRQELRSRYQPTLKRGNSGDPPVAVSNDGQKCPLAENRDEVRAIVVAMRAKPPEPRSVLRRVGAFSRFRPRIRVRKIHATSSPSPQWRLFRSSGSLTPEEHPAQTSHQPPIAQRFCKVQETAPEARPPDN